MADQSVASLVERLEKRALHYENASKMIPSALVSSIQRETAKELREAASRLSSPEPEVRQLLMDHSAALEFVREIAQRECSTSETDCQCLICRARTWLHTEDTLACSVRKRHGVTRLG